jgi:hypothetical protein
MGLTNVKKTSTDEIRFKDLFNEKDITDMSNENIDSIFNSVYQYIMKNAVYPHLAEIRII